MKKIKGLGDAVALVTKTLGIQPCEACIERQKRWNVLHPFKLISREVTEQEWQDFKNNKLDICTFYASVFNRPIYIPCEGCSQKPIAEMLNQINKLYETN